MSEQQHDQTAVPTPIPLTTLTTLSKSSTNRSTTSNKSLHEDAAESPLLRVEEELQEVVHQPVPTFPWIPWIRWSVGDFSQFNRQRVLKWTLIALVPLVLYIIFAHIDLQDVLEDVLRFYEENAVLGGVFFVLFYATCTVVLIPGTPFIIAAGVVFQPPLFATLLCVAGSAIGATISFFLARYFFRSDVVNWLGRREALDGESPTRFSAIDRAIATSDGWTILLLLRLSPVIPFSLLNYILALTDVSFVAFISSSCLGIIPGTIMYAITGSLLGTIAGAGKSINENPTAKYLVLYFSTIMIVLSTALITVAARRALRRALAAKELEEGLDGFVEEDEVGPTFSWTQFRNSPSKWTDLLMQISHIGQGWLEGYTSGEKRFMWWMFWGTLCSIAVGVPLIVIQTS
jgi:uncharacterized membrane protein YdjX (TVP38/TMEM64 family)